MSSLPLDRLGHEDVQILKREAGAIRGHVCKVIVLEQTDGRPLPTLGQLRAHVDGGLDATPRLRRRLVPTPLRIANPVWLDDPHFDIGRHITKYQASGPITASELQSIIAELMARPLDRAHPLWHIEMIDGLENGGMALVWRVHHSMADGTASMRLGRSLLWCEDPDQCPCEPSCWCAAPEPGVLRLLAAGIGDRMPRAPLARRAARKSAHGSHVIRRELGWKAAITPLGHRVGSERSVAFAEAPLEECKCAGKAIHPDVTLNDVVLAIIAGGIGRWLAHVNGPRDGIRVKVPVSLHSDHDKLANHDSYFVVDLPVAETDPAQRVLAINRETIERKLDHDAETLYRLGRYELVSRWAMSPHVFTFNVSNVRGPATSVYVLGARVRSMYSLAEISQHHALRVAVLSSGGLLSFGLCADRESVPRLDVVAEGIRSSTQELLAIASAA
jgi:diacylglycerol O-acyltransferase / wax synthase